MKRTASNPASPDPSVHGNGSSTKRPKRKWRPEVERDRSMRAYEMNPRALESENLHAEQAGFDACQEFCGHA